MKILYTLTAYPPCVGGAQLLQHQVAQQLLPRHEVQVVTQWNTSRTDWLLGTTLRAPEQSEDYVIDGVPVHRLGISRWEKVSIAPYIPIYYPLMDFALPPISACFERHLYRFAQNVHLIHGVRQGREGMCYAALQIARKRDVPFVLTTVHHPRWVGWRYRLYTNLYRMADVLIALTNVEKRILVELGVREERIFVTGMGPIIATEAYPERFLQDHHIDGPMVLFLARHYRYKGYQELLRATRLVWEKVPEAHFVFLGNAVGRSEQVFDGYQDYRIHRIVGATRQVKNDALAACTLLCMPSSQESFGAVYTEAWSHGKPVIGCNIPAVCEVISDGIDGYLVEQEPARIAERICDILLHPNRGRAMGAAGQRKVQAHYTWPQIAQRTEQAYNAALRGT